MSGKTRVLFIGNSYTYYNDMPEIFARVCAKNGVAAEVESVTAGGYYLEYFLSPDDPLGKEAQNRLRGDPYDLVVMQEQSLRPAAEPEVFLRCAGELCALVCENGATPVFYETWAYSDENAALAENNWTHEEMQALLRDAYGRAAAENGAILVCAGDAFSKAYRAGEDVFDPDGSHPSEKGSELIAREFYRVLIADRRNDPEVK